MKSLIAKPDIVIFYQYEIFAITAAEKIIIRKNMKVFIITSKYYLLCNKWGIIEKKIFCCIVDDGLTLKTLKLAYIGFGIQTLHNNILIYSL